MTIKIFKNVAICRMAYTITLRVLMVCVYWCQTSLGSGQNDVRVKIRPGTKKAGERSSDRGSTRRRLINSKSVDWFWVVFLSIVFKFKSSSFIFGVCFYIIPALQNTQSTLYLLSDQKILHHKIWKPHDSAH